MPTIDELKKLIQINGIKNCPITDKDVDLAEKIFGPSIPALKGKSTRRRPEVIVDQTISLPNELKDNLGDVVLHMDLIFVNGVAFMTTIDPKIKYWCAIALDGQKEPDFVKALLRIKLLYKCALVEITGLMCDGQFLLYQDVFE